MCLVHVGKRNTLKKKKNIYQSNTAP